VRALSPILGLAFWASVILATPARSSPPEEWRAHDEAVGQEYQRDGTATAHADGSWTAAWVDYCTGYGSIFVRSFDSDDEPLGPASPVTDGYGLFSFDVNAEQVSQPFLASLGGGRSILVWVDSREGHPDVRAALVDQQGIVEGPVLVSEEGPYSVKRVPHIAVSGDRALVVWTEGDSPLRKVRAQILTSSLETVSSNFSVDPTGEDVQSDPRAVASASGWVVAWSGDSQDPAHVFVRPFDRDGDAAADAKLVESDPTVIQNEPAIIQVAGGYFVTWTKGFSGEVSLAGRLLDADLNPAGPSFLISSEEETVTPRGPELLALDAASILVVWTAGPGQDARFHARKVVLPSTAAGSIVVVDDPTPPPGQSLTPRNLALVPGSTTPARLVWSDAREGWELMYQLTADAEGHPLSMATPLDPKDGTASQVFPDIVIFPDHRGAVVWEDFRSGTMGIYGAYLDGEGRPTGGSFRISEISGGASSAPADNMRDLIRNRPVLGATLNGSLVVGWTALLGGGPRVTYQVYDPIGVPVGGNTLVLPACGDGVQGQPAFAATKDGGFYLAWWDTCTGGSGDVYAQRFLVDGSADSDTIRVADRAYLGATQLSPAVSSGEGGETVVAWLDDRMGNFDVYAQRIGPTGTKIGSNIPISIPEEGGTVVQSNPDVASQADRFVVVWDEEPYTGGGVVGLLVVLPSAKDGGSQKDDQISFQLAGESPGMKYPRVAMAPDGRFVVTYWDTSADSARVIAQRFDAYANPIGARYSVNILGGEVASLQGAVAADRGRIRYAFVDNRDHRSWDIRVKTVSWFYEGDYTPVAVGGWAIVEQPDALEIRWSVPADLAGGAYRVWREAPDGADYPTHPGREAILVSHDPVMPFDSGGLDYTFRDPSAAPGTSYLYWIEDAAGDFAGPWTGRRSAPRLALDLQAGDNPFSRSVRLSWSLPRAEDSDLTIYDISGRLVRTLLPSRKRAPGAGEQVWDGSDESGRAVPAGVYWARLRSAEGERSVKLLRLR
jgi:hypothetical protein